MAPDDSIGVHGRVPEHRGSALRRSGRVSASKKEAAKDEAAAVAGHAAGEAQNVAETAKAEAATSRPR